MQFLQIGGIGRQPTEPEVLHHRTAGATERSQAQLAPWVRRHVPQLLRNRDSPVMLAGQDEAEIAFGPAALGSDMPGLYATERLATTLPS